MILGSSNYNLASGVISSGGGVLSPRSYAAMLYTAPGGLKTWSVNHLDLVPMAGCNELVNGSEETRSPINCFEFEFGASSLEKAGLRLDRRSLQGGSTPMRQTMRFLCSLQRALESFRADVDQVLSTGLGLKPKTRCGLRMRVGFKVSLKQVRPRSRTCFWVIVKP